jgi:hypothetical protein
MERQGRHAVLTPPMRYEWLPGNDRGFYRQDFLCTSAVGATLSRAASVHLMIHTGKVLMCSASRPVYPLCSLRRYTSHATRTKYLQRSRRLSLQDRTCNYKRFASSDSIPFSGEQWFSLADSRRFSYDFSNFTVTFLYLVYLDIIHRPSF